VRVKRFVGFNCGASYRLSIDGLN